MGERALIAKRAIAEALADGRDVDEQWLQHLYDRHVDRFLSDNNRIWATANFLVPISLAALPAFFGLSNPGVVQAVAFGLFAVVVMWVWAVVARRHKILQSRSYDVMAGIEMYVLGDERRMLIREAVKTHSPDEGIAARHVPRILVISTIVIWTGVVALHVLRLVGLDLMLP